MHGRVLAYQHGSGDASAIGSNIDSHDDTDLDSVGITHGSPPHQYIWTYMAGVSEVLNACPYNDGSTVVVQSFVGDDYYCESDNPLGNIGTMFFQQHALGWQ